MNNSKEMSRGNSEMEAQKQRAEIYTNGKVGGKVGWNGMYDVYLRSE